jgi:hypothetical protein
MLPPLRHNDSLTYPGLVIERDVFLQQWLGHSATEAIRLIHIKLDFSIWDASARNMGKHDFMTLVANEQLEFAIEETGSQALQQHLKEFGYAS